MTVVTSRNDPKCPADIRCSVCVETICPPFVLWRTPADDWVICAPCCRDLCTGLTADMFRCVAIADPVGEADDTARKEGDDDRLPW